jgi:ubiquinone/menaquinone biosynthesis C-methylase UbiE
VTRLARRPDPERKTDAIDERGFSAVDAQPDPAYLVHTMEVTAQWPSVLRLRAWERDHLALGPGDEVLDVGCGIGEVTRSYATLVQPGGRVVGIDASAAMLEVARERAAATGVDATFRVGDALSLDETDASFDACRAERVLQWLPDMEGAVAEMLRVLRPRGRLCLTDTDWRTFMVDLPDRFLAATITDAIVDFRGDGAPAASRLLNLCRDAGLTDLEHTGTTHIWSSWDPDVDPGPPGLFPLADVFGAVVAAGHLDASDADRFLEHIQTAARADRLYLSVGMTSVFGCVPRPS